MSDFSRMGFEDKRRQADATNRNREVILDVLRKHLLTSGTILELGSGTGEHAAHMAAQFPTYDWQPSDFDADNQASIDAWAQDSKASNILPALLLDIMQPRWPVEMIRPAKPVTAILAINIIHITPWPLTEALLDGAARMLPLGGVLYFYGPYMVGGEHTAQSNVQFDAWLKDQDQSWGVRDMDEVGEMARSYGFSKPNITPMPANNFSLVFKKL